MARFHKLKVKEVTRETTDCVSVAFDVPPALREEFKYIHGQYLTFRMKVRGEEVRRSYSLCSSPLVDDEFRVAVKMVSGGRVSTLFNNELKPGDEMDVMTPMGSFHSPINISHHKHYILFAGGSGITPMLSILKTVLAGEPDSRITLFYGNRDEESIIFRTQIDAIAAKNPQRFSVIYILEKTNAADPLFKGMITLEKGRGLVAKYVDLKYDNEFFICGPGPMMENVKDVLRELNVPVGKVHIEYFSAVIEAVKAAEEKTPEGEKIESKVTVILDGEAIQIDLSSEGQVILDAALDGGLDVPFACKGAVCCTCRAKVMEGKVRMEMNFALSEEEVAQGYVLTCQAHPVSERVVVDYDQP